MINVSADVQGLNESVPDVHQKCLGPQRPWLNSHTTTHVLTPFHSFDLQMPVITKKNITFDICLALKFGSSEKVHNLIYIAIYISNFK